MARRSASTALSVTALLLLGTLTACTSEEATSLTAPAVYYLPPYGEKSAVNDKPVFEVRAEGGSSSPRTGTRRATVDVVGGSEDVVRLRRSGPECRGGAAHVTCDIPGDFLDGGGNQRVVPVAAKGAEVGESAVVRFTYTTKDGKKLTARTEFVVGEPVVEVLAPKAFEHVRPGAELTAPLVVRNSGTVPVRGLGLELQPGSTEYAERYANCRYLDRKHYDGNAAVCRFPDVRIAPGETVALKTGLRLRASETAMYGTVEARVWPLDTKPESRTGAFGDGPSLEVVAAEPVRGAFRAGSATTPVTLDTHADYQVTGADLHGGVEDTRTVRLTVRNNGPGDPGFGTQLVFSPPFGAVVEKQPMTEIDDGEYGPYCDSDGSAYTCDIDELGPGSSRTFEFTLSLGEPGAGLVSLRDKGHHGRRDLDPTNDQAAVTVTR
ncbi:hypothetical protein ACWC09_17950 [Streptomyces sp. NPDC001617]